MSVPHTQAVSAPPDGRARLEEVEQPDDGRPPYMLTYPELKLLGIAGVSCLSDTDPPEPLLIRCMVSGWILPRW
jgi:hypothetical protein